jgi:pyridinium-3,5-bisthiocarboxylic acid mononucleotide nickel chelatase
MNNILYYDCFAGISGDMNLAALVDLGVDPAFLINELGKLHIDEFKITFSKDMRRGISGTKAEVIIKGNEHSHEHHHPHGHEHSHDHRTFKDIKDLFRKSGLSEFVKNKSIAIFQKIADAEGKVHNKPADEVHFHEVGAVDSIVDIAGAAICIEFLKPSRIIASRIELGSGMVKCEHGIFPVPAPATAEILKGIPVKSGNVPFEATTPTGAAILAVFVDEFVEKHQFTLLKTGYGIGHKDSEVPNVLRVHWASASESKFKTETVAVIECNIDDMNPEIYDYILEKLFKEGADDVFLSPVIMKKSRPANTISVLCNQSSKDKLISILLSETSTIGVRTYDVVKHILEREIIELNTRLGKIKIKKSWFGNDIIKYKPEYDDCIKIAKERNLKLSEVIQIVQDEISKTFK